MLALLMACATPEIATAEASAVHTSDAVDARGADCKTTCSLGDAQESEHLSHEELDRLLETWSTQALDDPTIELETLLFHFQDTRSHLAQNDVPLDDAHLAYLHQELSRDAVTIEMRLLDERGEVRGTLASTDVPLKEKQHIQFQGTGSLGHLETAGKVKRVGLGHLWSRW